MFTYFSVYFSVFVTTVTNVRTAEKALVPYLSSLLFISLY